MDKAGHDGQTAPALPLWSTGTALWCGAARRRAAKCCLFCSGLRFSALLGLTHRFRLSSCMLCLLFLFLFLLPWLWQPKSTINLIRRHARCGALAAALAPPADMRAIGNFPQCGEGRALGCASTSSRQHDVRHWSPRALQPAMHEHARRQTQQV